jgi:hypothetical protein
MSRASHRSIRTVPKASGAFGATGNRRHTLDVQAEEPAARRRNPMRKLAVTAAIGAAIVMSPVVSSTVSALANQEVQRIEPQPDVDTINDGTSNTLTVTQASEPSSRGGKVRFW